MFGHFFDSDKPTMTHLVCSSFVATKAVLPLMLKKRRGHIINVVSIAASTYFTDSAAYSASKAGLLALMNVLRKEVRKFNIKISCIMPGAVDTAMWDSRSRQRYSKRMMTPRELGSIILTIAEQPKKVLIEDVVVRPIRGDI